MLIVVPLSRYRYVCNKNVVILFIDPGTIIVKTSKKK